jgi:outer membrane protein assembly factor BamB
MRKRCASNRLILALLAGWWASEAFAESSPAKPKDWAHYKGGPGRTFAWDDKEFRPPFELKWVFWGEDSGTKDGMLAVEGVVLFANVGRFGGGNIYGVDAKTGKEIWRQSVGGPYVATMDSTAGLVFFPEQSRGLLAFEVRTGDLAWSREDLRGDVNPLAVDGLVYTSKQEGGFHALDAETAKDVWRNSDVGKVGSSAYGEGLVVVLGDGRLTALDAATGERKWSAEAASRIHGLYPIAIADGVVFAPEGGGAFRLADGKQLWTGGGRHRCYGQGLLFGNTFAVDAKTGRTLWAVSRKDLQSAGDICGAPIYHNGVIYFGTGFGSSSKYVESFFALDAKSGRVLWRYKSGGVVCTSPIIYDRRLYFASADRGLYCFEPVRKGRPK